MPETPSPRLRLHSPAPGDIADVPADIRRLRDQLDTVVLAYDEGLALSRPVTAARGRVYFATDTGVLYYRTDSAWRAVAPETEPSRTITSLLNGFTASATRTPRYWRDGTRIHFAGSLISPGLVNVAAFTLPAGYRPTTETVLPTLQRTSTQVNAPAYAVVSATGSVSFSMPGGSSPGLEVTLDNVSFDTMR